MSQTLKTVIISTDNGPVIINECDFDKEIHTLFVGEETLKEERERIFSALVLAGKEGKLKESSPIEKLRKAFDKI